MLLVPEEQLMALSGSEQKVCFGSTEQTFGKGGPSGFSSNQTSEVESGCHGGGAVVVLLRHSRIGMLQERTG